MQRKAQQDSVRADHRAEMMADFFFFDDFSISQGRFDEH